jgi:polysaccharide biosynthesis transport protein
MDQYPPQLERSARDLVPSGYAQTPDFYRNEGNPYSYYAEPETTAPEQGFDLYKYIRILNKYKWMILSVVLLGLLVSGIITYLATPIYRSTTTIQIERGAVEVTEFKTLQNDEAATGAEFFQTQYQLLQSRSLSEKVATTAGLLDNAAFDKQPSNVFTIIKKLIRGEEQTDQAPSLDAKQNRAVNQLQDQVFINPLRGSRIVKISFDHPDPEIAQLVANSYAEVFISDSLNRKFEATSYARKFLEERLQQLKIKLESSERQLVAYAEQNGLFKLNENKDLATSDLETINTNLSEVRSNRIKAELLWKQAQQSDGFGLKEILDSKAIQENRKLRSELAAKYQQKLAIYKPAFPEMIELRNQIKELDRSAASEVTSIKSSIESLYIAAQEEEQALQAQLDSRKGQVSDERNRSIEYNILQREVDTNRQLYDGLLQRYKEIGISSGVGTNNVSIVDRAVLPISPTFPRKIPALSLGLLSGLLLGVLLAFLRDYFDDTFKVPEDIEREAGIPVVGVIPKVTSNESIDVIFQDPRSAISEAVRSFRTGLQFATSDGLPKSLLITSSKPSEGKTTTSIALAKSVAELGLNVLLIDGDLRNASAHKRLNISNAVGLSNFLTGSMQPDDCVQSTNIPGLTFMASGPLPPNPAELLSGQRFLSLLALARDSFDIVIIDGPPVMGLADSPILARNTSATVLVVEANSTRKSVLAVALKRLRFARANIIGALMTKFDVAQTGYGYGYGDSEYSYHSYGNNPLLPSGE